MVLDEATAHLDSESERAVHEALDRDPPGYWESFPLRRRIARLYRERHGIELDPARILLTCGASPALLLALLARFEAGDRIAFARPGYTAYRNTTLAAHMQPVMIGCGPETRYQLTAGMIAALDPVPAGIIIASGLYLLRRERVHAEAEHP